MTAAPDSGAPRSPSYDLGARLFVFWLLNVFVSAYLLFRLADAIFICIIYGTDTYLAGLRVVDWKHGTLSDGRQVPFHLEMLRVPLLGFLPWAAWSVGSWLLLRRIRIWWWRRRTGSSAEGELGSDDRTGRRG